MEKESNFKDIDHILDDIIINYVKELDLPRDIEIYYENKVEFEEDTIEEYITQVLEKHILEHIIIKSLLYYQADIVYNYIEKYNTMFAFKNVKITDNEITFTLNMLNRNADENTPKKIEREFKIDIKSE